MAAGDSSRVQEAQKIAKTDPSKAEAIYKEIVSQAPAATSDAATREYEQALISLGELYKDEKLVCNRVQEKFISNAMLTHPFFILESHKIW